MLRVIGLLLALAGMLAATQVFNWSLEETLGFTEAVLIVRVESFIEFPGDYTDRIEYYFKVLDVISGPDSLDGEFLATYEMLYPRLFYDDEGNEVWESPIVSGSGYEMLTREGDTVIVLLDRLPDDQQQYAGVKRVEPLESLDSIQTLLYPEQEELIQIW